MSGFVRIAQMASLLVCSFSISAHANTQAEIIEALQAQLLAVTERLEVLEAKQATRTVATSSYAQLRPAAVATAPAAETIKLKGDFRYRHDATNADGSRERHRQRIRARAAVTGKVSDTVSAGFGLATGGSDPISTNQSFDDGGSSKGVVIDLAYVNWKAPLEGLIVTAGKFKNPLRRVGGHALVWDGDFNPEGVGAKFSRGIVFANALVSWIDESSSDDDSFLFGGQFGVKQDVADTNKVTAGFGYYNVIDARGEMPFFDGSASGNRVNADGEYLSGFEIVEAFVEYDVALENGKITVFGDVVQNLDASDFDTGYALGVKYKNSDWSMGYAYQDLEADAVVGTFTDSDFRGGGTDGKGHVLRTGYSLSERISLNGTLFLNERNVDFGTQQDYNRLFLDISFKY